MNLRDRGKISGIFPRRVAAEVLHEGPSLQLSLQDVLDIIGREIEKFDCRKTFSIVSPKGMGADDALASIRKGAYRITESSRQVEIRILQEM